MNGKKRLMTELTKLRNTPPDFFFAEPLDDNIYEWHFTVIGPENSAYEGGLYHGKVLLPEQYPIKPPDVIFMTPSGRFEIGKKLCLTNTSYHPESWSPLWTIRNMIESIFMIFPQKDVAGIGHIRTTPDVEIRRLAEESKKWKCNNCGCNQDHINQLGEILRLKKTNSGKKATESAKKATESVKNVLTNRAPIETIAENQRKSAEKLNKSKESEEENIFN